jgi:hypothetical protein
VIAHHVALALAALALAAAAVRLAALAAPRGLERALAAAAIGVAAAVVESLLLGLAGLGTEPLALVPAAIGTWLAAMALAPAPEVAPGAELVGWWRGCPQSWRLIAGAAAGAGVAWAAWQMRYPALGTDSLLYHLPEVVTWIQNGTPGSVEQVYALPGLPVGNYPLTNEVVLAWGMGIGRSFVPASLLAPLMMLLLVVAGWAGLRELRVPRSAAALGLAAVCLTPVLTHWQRNGAYTDLPTMAWLATTGALCAASLRRPALLAPALLAGALAVGTKTTAGPLAAAALIAAGWAIRASLRPLAGWLLAAAIAGGVAGGYWYLRNLVDHGSPFWPLVATPWGDPVPRTLSVYDVRFIEHPRLMVRELGDRYVDLFAGGIILLAGAVIAPFLARSRAVTAAAVATAVAVLIWTSSPLTGEIPNGGGVTTLRYLMPTLAAAVLTLGLAARRPGASRAFASAALAAGAVAAAITTVSLGTPRVPSLSTPLLGALAGAAVALALSRLPQMRPPPRRALALAPALLAVLAGLALAAAAPGYVERHARVAGIDTVRWFAARDRERGGEGPIALAPGLYAPFAGARLQHRLDAIPAGEGCAAVVRRSERGLVLINKAAIAVPGFERILDCFAGRRPAFDGIYNAYGG